MEQFKKEFVDFALEAEALRFGDFTLKSGRKSPFFFNAGRFDSGRLLGGLCRFYAHALQNSGLKPDVIFGPAYKGIPLAAGTAIEYWRLTGEELKWSSLRKEVKDHGDKGAGLGHTIVPGEKVLVIDDVVTSGISADESIAALKSLGADVIGFLCSLDRAERGLDTRISALKSIEQKWGVRSFAIVSLPEAVAYLTEEKPSFLTPDQLNKIKMYFAEYGAEKE